MGYNERQNRVYFSSCQKKKKGTKYSLVKDHDLWSLVIKLVQKGVNCPWWFQEVEQMVFNLLIMPYIGIPKVLIPIISYYIRTSPELDANGPQSLDRSLVNENSSGQEGYIWIENILILLQFSQNHCKEYYLNRNNIGDIGTWALMSAIVENTTLQFLHLAGNNITDLGAKVIAGTLKHNSILTRLDLGCNKIGNEGTKAIAESLKSNITLSSLGLAKNRICDVGAKDIASAIKSNTMLTELLLSGNKIGDAGATSIAKGLKLNQALVHLDLDRNKIGAIGTRSIGKILGESAIDSVFEDHSVHPWGFQIPFNEHYKKWKVTNVYANQQAEQLEVKIGDQIIAIDGVSIDDQNHLVMEQILCKRKRCTLTFARTSCSLSRLKLSLNACGHKGGEVIGLSLEVNSTMVTLYLDESKLGDFGVASIGKSLSKNSILQLLTLSKNNIGDIGAVAIAIGLQKNLALNYLRLNNNNISDIGAAALGSVLKRNQILKYLSLANNNIGNIGARGIGNGLEVNSALNELYLQNNQIADDGGQAIGNALGINSSLKVLWLQENYIADTGARKIANALRKKKLISTAKFEPGKIGMELRGNAVVSVTPNSQAQHNGIKIGWIISKVNGQGQVDSSKIVDAALDKPTVIQFKYYNANTTIRTIILERNNISRKGINALKVRRKKFFGSHWPNQRSSNKP